MNQRTMLCLPLLSRGGGNWRLPLCDTSAIALAGALVDENLADRAAQIAASLALDPAVAIWGICRWMETGQEPSLLSQFSLAYLADWLSPRLAALLDWTSAAHTLELTNAQHGQFAALVAESVGAAQAANAAIGIDDPNRHAIYLRALVARWNEWFEATRGSEASPECPPPENPFAMPAPAPIDSPTAPAVSDEAWRRWLVEIPGIQTLLPGLVAQQRLILDLNASFESRLHTAKLDALKEFAYGAGHELNNPLANIASRAQTLLSEESNPERRRRLAAINTQAFRGHEMLADLMLFARPPQLNLEPVDLVQLTNEVLAELNDAATLARTSLHRPTRRDPLVIEADPVQLRVALRALCVNALEAIGQQGNLTVDLCVSDADPRITNASADVVQIVVSDDGPGIPPEIRTKIFDPFFSGREAGRGLGFGLSKCWRIVDLHGGWIDVNNPPGHGATFTLVLPAKSSPADTLSPVGATSQA